MNLYLLLTVALLALALYPEARIRLARRRSHAIAARRGVGSLPILVRVATLDLELDLERASGEVLMAQRAALLERLAAPEAGDDLGALATRAQAVAGAIATHNAAAAGADAARAALLNVQPARTSGGAPDRADSADPADGDTPAAPVNLGRAFTATPEFRSYSSSGSGRSGTAVIPGEVRALFAASNFPSQNTRVPGIQTPDRDTPLTILDMIDRQGISTNVVEWVREDAVPAGAAEVAEGGLKPESTWAVSLQTSVAAVIAHWVNITRQALSDETQIQGYINGRLTYGLLKRLNAQVLNGNGTAPNLRGILNTSGIGTYVSPAGEDPLISIRKARTVAELSEYSPDGVVVHPTNWQAVELSVDNNGQFKAVTDVGNGLTPRVWGLNVIVTTNITVATFLVGGFREGATLWEREGVEIYITDSHASNFTSNILTLLAEMRAALSVWRPKAFVKGTLTPAA
jgi:hypothetical protein